MNAMLVLEAWAPFGLSTAAVLFLAGSVSPVKLLSSMVRSMASNNRKSAGTLSPTFKITTSPGTNSLARNVSGELSLKLRKIQKYDDEC